MIISKQDVEDFTLSIIKLHDRIVQETGGEFGIRDYGGLYNSSYRALSYQENNTDPFRIAAFILLEFGKRHHFFDGNKRIAYAIMKTTLLKRGYYFLINYEFALYFIIEIVRFDIQIKLSDVRAWIKDNIVLVPEKDIGIYLKEFDF